MYLPSSHHLFCNFAGREVRLLLHVIEPSLYLSLVNSDVRYACYPTCYFQQLLDFCVGNTRRTCRRCHAQLHIPERQPIEALLTLTMLPRVQLFFSCATFSTLTSLPHDYLPIAQAAIQFEGWYSMLGPLQQRKLYSGVRRILGAPQAR